MFTVRLCQVQLDFADLLTLMARQRDNLSVVQAAAGSPEPIRQSLDVPPSLIYQSSCQYFSWPILEPQVTLLQGTIKSLKRPGNNIQLPLNEY